MPDNISMPVFNIPHLATYFTPPSEKKPATPVVSKMIPCFGPIHAEVKPQDEKKPEPVAAASVIKPPLPPQIKVDLASLFPAFPNLFGDDNEKAIRSNSWIKSEVPMTWTQHFVDDIPARFVPVHSGDVRMVWMMYSVWMHCRPKTVNCDSANKISAEFSNGWYPFLLEGGLVPGVITFLQWMQRNHTVYRITTEEELKCVLSNHGAVWCEAGFILSGINITTDSVTLYSCRGENLKEEIAAETMPLEHGFLATLIKSNNGLFFLKKPKG